MSEKHEVNYDDQIAAARKRVRELVERKARALRKKYSPIGQVAVEYLPELEQCRNQQEMRAIFRQLVGERNLDGVDGDHENVSEEYPSDVFE